MEITYKDGNIAGDYKKALIVDDSQDVLRVVAKKFEKCGYRCTAVDNGNVAWELLREEVFPLIVLDWMLPGITGIELCRRIRSLPHGEFATIIIVTAKNRPEDWRLAIEAGADDYVTKPFSMDLLDIRLTVAEKMIVEKLSRKLADEEAANSEKRYRTILETVPDLVYQLDDNGCFQFVSDRISDFGYEAEDLIGKHFSVIMYPDDATRVSREKVLAERRDELAGGDPPSLFDERRTGKRRTKNLELRLRSKKNTERIGACSTVCEVCASGIYDKGVGLPEKKFLGTIGTIRDVTDRYRAEAALRDSEARYREIFRATGDGFVLFDVQRTIVEANPAACEMYGYSYDEMVGMKADEIMAPETSKYFADFEKQLHKTGTYFSEALHRRRNGATFAVEVRGAKLSVHGRPRLLAVVQDISHRREAEEALLRAERLAAIGQLAGGIAHDFNNILTMILGYSDLLHRELEHIDPTLHEFAGLVATGAERAGELTHQLLAFARRGKMRALPINVHDILLEVMSLLKHSLNKKIKVHRYFDASNAIVTGDTSQLENAIMNLAVNASDAMQEGGELSFITKNIIASGEGNEGYMTRLKEGQYIEIEVRDTGEGISDDVLPKVFEPFFTTKESGKGTGLGLASVYGCVQEHGGSVKVKTVFGEGTSFFVALPIPAIVRHNDTGDHNGEVMKGCGKILIVDDEDEVRELAANMLRGLGYSVILCNDGREAVLRYAQEIDSIDMVLLDFFMPNINGYETYLALKDVDAGVKVLLSSGHGQDEQARKMIESGEVEFISKPYRLDELSRKVNAVLA